MPTQFRRPTGGMSVAVRLWMVVAVLAFVAASVRAQCPPQWLPGDGVPGVNGFVYATALWDPDGLGPLTPRLVVGGSFTVAGNVLANNIATYDPVTGLWAALGSGMSPAGGQVRALATLPNGDLVAGGGFTTAGGITVNCIAGWNGTAWSPLGLGMGGVAYPVVSALTIMPNGDLVAGGAFTTAGDVAANRIARWNGTAWSALGSGMGGASPDVYALTRLPNGDLVAGGRFTTAGGVTANRIARWNGTAWSALGTGMENTVYALTSLSNGDMIAGGYFFTAGGTTASRIARWNGTSWSALGSGMGGGNPIVYALTSLPNGELVAGGQFTTAGGAPAEHIARWNGTAWSALASEVDSPVYALTTLPSGDLVAGGGFSTAGNVRVRCIARWDGAGWSALSTGIDREVFTLTTLPNGDLIAGGFFDTAGAVTATRIAKWNGTAWSALGSGMNGIVYATTALSNGDLVAGGYFTTAGGVVVNNIALWNGTTWSPFGLGTGGSYPVVFALATLPNGDLIAGGSFTTVGGLETSLGQWDSMNWSALGSWGTGDVYTMVKLPNGDLVVGGGFSTAGGVPANCVARWDGVAWSALGSGLSGGFDRTTVYALTPLPNGDLVVGGEFTAAGGVPASRIARWNGTAWSALGSGMGTGSYPSVYALTTLPNGDVIAGGYFTSAGGVAANRIARWNGVVWSALGAGMDGTVEALTTLPNGDLMVGGRFTAAGGNASAYLARWGTPVAPTLVTQPLPVSTCPSGSAAFSVTASGTAPLTYSWRKGGTPIDPLTNPSAAADTLTLTNVSTADAGSYDCIISNTCDSVTSDPATLTVCLADYNCDGFMDGIDYDLFNADFESYDPLQQIHADINGDGFVDGIDYDLFNYTFETGCL